MSDSQKLARALEYVRGGKFNEALPLLSNLNGKYRLNPRYKAYLGLCYYHEWKYQEACAVIDSVLTEIEVFAPHERSVYYHASAESHFALGEYKRAIPLYEMMINVCYDIEKGDALYRLGFCYMFEGRNDTAAEYFKSALCYYNKYIDQERKSRIIQIEKMVKGLETKVNTNTNENENEKLIGKENKND
ncbi:MAG: tetratricopeptide repeat protein [Prevotella sp.]